MPRHDCFLQLFLLLFITSMLSNISVTTCLVNEDIHFHLGCNNLHKDCNLWARQGLCKSAWRFMTRSCCLVCSGVLLVTFVLSISGYFIFVCLLICFSFFVCFLVCLFNSVFQRIHAHWINIQILWWRGRLIWNIYRSSRPEVLLGKGVLKICSKFTGEHPCRSAISAKLLCNFIEIALRNGCSPVNLLHIFRTPFLLKNTSGGTKIANALRSTFVIFVLWHSYSTHSRQFEFCFDPVHFRSIYQHKNCQIWKYCLHVIFSHLFLIFISNLVLRILARIC